jgi:hypothetical protein
MEYKLTADINPDLSSYVAQKAIEGLFYEIAQEELKIRQNISARNTTLLQKYLDMPIEIKAKA